jgi:hypothetical protein
MTGTANGGRSMPSINMTMDVYGHLFNDLDFNRRQVELLESVRKPLEKTSELQYATL